MIKLKQLLVEKTLYHGTTIDNVRGIEAFGLLPSVGKFVKDAYDMSGYGEDIDPDDYLKELVFSADKKQLKNAVTAITAQVAIKLSKGFHDVTDQEFVHYGALVIIKDGEQVMNHREEDENHNDDHPYTVEPGDYYSEDNIPVDYILTGQKMISIFKRYNVWPRHHVFGGVDIKYKKDFLIKQAIKRNPTRQKSKILKIINSFDEKTINRYYEKCIWDRKRSIKESTVDENMSYEDLLKLTAKTPESPEDGTTRIDRAKNVRVRSIPVSTEGDSEQWNFRYKSDKLSGNPGKPLQGHITFLKGEVGPDDDASILECKVDCSCPDYKYRFAANNHAQGASDVGPGSLNQAINRRPQPVYNIGAGLCKHLSSLAKYLETKIPSTVKKSNLFETIGNIARQGPFNITYYD